MAQGDLYRLLKRVSATLARDMDTKSKGSERFRQKVERLPHDVYIDQNEIEREILIQLRDFQLTENLKNRGIKNAQGGEIQQGIRTTLGAASGRTREESALAVQSTASDFSITDTQLKAVKAAAARFVAIARTFSKARIRGFTMKILEDTGTSIAIRVTPTTATANPFNIIKKEIFAAGKTALARSLDSVGLGVTKARQDIFFNVGHVNSVSTLKAAEAISRINTGTARLLKKYDDPVSSDAVDLIRLGVLSKFVQFGRPEYSKEFLFEAAVVKAESQATNLTDSDYERALLNDLRRSINKTIESMPNDWQGQKSSDSIIDLVANDLLEQMHTSFNNKSVKTNGPKPRKASTASNKANDSIKLKKPKTNPIRTSAKDYDMNLKLGSNRQAARPSIVSMQYLVPLINANLAQIIKGYMGQLGRLNNRTGRFAESAEVVSIDEGTMSIGYTYMMNPYSVYETHPTRNPRPLIESSIRDVATKLTQQRFNMRRI